MTDESESPEQPLLRVRDLHTWFPIKRGLLRKTVGHVRAVDGVSFDIPAGQTMALVGESGCGKTTVGRSILRLIEPDSGEVTFEGRNMLTLSGEALRLQRRRMQMVFQDPMTSLDPRMRVRDILTEGMESFGLYPDEKERNEKVASLLETVRLDPRQVNRYPHEFSGGQRQRIGIARALSVDPQLIVLDEAVSALDVSIQAQVLNLLGELQDRLGLAYLFITHDLSVVRYISDAVSVMYLGQIVEQGPTKTLFESPKHPYTQGLLASVPSVDPRHRRLKATVLGDVPSPASPPQGCRFHTRCPMIFEPCKGAIPNLYRVGELGVRCYLYDPQHATEAERARARAAAESTTAESTTAEGATAEESTTAESTTAEGATAEESTTAESTTAESTTAEGADESEATAVSSDRADTPPRP